MNKETIDKLNFSRLFWHLGKLSGMTRLKRYSPIHPEVEKAIKELERVLGYE